MSFERTRRFPAIVVPGIKGTRLENIYDVPADTTWDLTTILWSKVWQADYDRLALDAAALADEHIHVVTRDQQLLSFAYKELVKGLRGRLDTPVYLCPYDWRYSNARSAEGLFAFVKMLLDKDLSASAERLDDEQRFDFVCHSMGGLVFRAFLDLWRRRHSATLPPVGRVAFLATPHLGSLDAVEVMIRGESALLGTSKAARKLARRLPGVYELLPHDGLEDAVVNEQGEPVDIFKVASWQSNVGPASGSGDQVLQNRLDDAKDFLAALPDPKAPEYGIGRDNILCVYGDLPRSTLRRVEVIPRHGTTTNWYDFKHADKGNGDDTVPTESALALQVPSVAITAKDISLIDDFKAKAISLHAFLPTVDEVQTITGRFLQGATAANHLLPKNMAVGRHRS